MEAATRANDEIQTDKPFFTVETLENGIFRIGAPMGENIFLVVGDVRAALIDTGMGIGPLREEVEKLTDLPITVLNTHGHPDHAGGNAEFSQCLMHFADAPWFTHMCGMSYRRMDMRRILGGERQAWEDALQKDAPMPGSLLDGDELDLGGRSLRVIHTPGHTPGSVCFSDSRSHALFAGDSLSAAEVWLYDEYSEALDVYYHSLTKLWDSAMPMGRVLIGHPPGEVETGMIESMQACVRRVLMHDEMGVPHRTFAGEGLRYRYGGACIVYNPLRLFKGSEGRG